MSYSERVSVPIDPEFEIGLVDRGRRALHVAAAAVAILLTLPIMLLVALLVRLTSRGPVLYTQPRVGLDRRLSWRTVPCCRRRGDSGGRIFTIYKFRTMYVEDRTQDLADSQRWATPDDPRITAIGGFLRKYRLDELPQFFNVLRGDMNIVGPRPEQPQIFQELREKIAHYEERQQVLPGITGWAQINQSYDACLDDVQKKLTLDLEYIDRRSIVKDLLIMLRTVPVMVFKFGAW